MTAASTTKSQQEREFEFYGNAGSTLPVLDWNPYASVTSDNPTDLTGAADASAFVAEALVVAGQAAGDVCFGIGIVSGLAANSYPCGAYVTAATNLRVLIGGKINTSVTTTATVVNALILDVT